MFRNEVIQLDAITAILCIESSMTTSAIVDSVGNALHSNFTENPDQECILNAHISLLAYLHACHMGKNYQDSITIRCKGLKWHTYKTWSILTPPATQLKFVCCLSKTLVMC